MINIWYFDNREEILGNKDDTFPLSFVQTPAKLFLDSFSNILSEIPKIILKTQVNLEKDKVTRI